MRRAGVTVVIRPLRYHWDWGHRQPLPRPEPGLEGRWVTLHPWQRPQEKGIDLAIALDLIELLLLDTWDVAVVVSLDRDLREIPRAVRNLRPLVRRSVRLEAAVPVPDGLRAPRILADFHYTHQVTSEVFKHIRDDTDYTVPETVWVPPTPPHGIQGLPGGR